MSSEYNVFISWSGVRSRWVADGFRDWLPLVLQTAKPWMSASDIEKGARGLNEVANKLEEVKVGICCLTPENLDSHWILYEAGALSKTISDKARLCTYLLGGLQFQDVKYPLGMFQATNSDKADTLRLVQTINAAISAVPVPEKNLERVFEGMWPQLEAKLKSMPVADEIRISKRSLEDMVTEILEISRSNADATKLLHMPVQRIERNLRRGMFSRIGASTSAVDSVPLSSLISDQPPTINPDVVRVAMERTAQILRGGQEDASVMPPPSTGRGKDESKS